MIPSRGMANSASPNGFGLSAGQAIKPKNPCRPMQQERRGPYKLGGYVTLMYANCTVKTVAWANVLRVMVKSIVLSVGRKHDPNIAAVATRPTNIGSQKPLLWINHPMGGANIKVALEIAGNANCW